MNKITIFIILPLLLSGCLARKPEIQRHYIIEYPGDFTAAIDTALLPLDQTCLVLPVEVHPAFATHQIALRESSNEIRYFVLNVWAVRPESSFTNIVTRYLHNHNVFRSVYPPNVVRTADFSLATTVYRLEVLGERRDYSANLSVEFRLNDNTTGETAGFHRADRTVRLEDRDLNLFAGKISQLFLEELDIFVSSFSGKAGQHNKDL